MTKPSTKEILSTVSRLESELRKLKRQVRSLNLPPEHEELPGEEGVFDGEFMILDSGEKVKVPENYAAKSRLVYGDRLKKIIVDGKDKYKQIIKVSRKEVEGIITRKGGVWHVLTEYGSHSISNNAAEYNEVALNDHVVVVLPEKNPSVPYAALDRAIKDKSDEAEVTEVSSISIPKSAPRRNESNLKPPKKKELKKDEEISLKEDNIEKKPSEKKKSPKTPEKPEKKSVKEEVEKVTTLEDDDLR